MKLDLSDPILKDLPKAYLVGGSVRDMVRGDKPMDYDIVVPGDPEIFASIIAERLNKKAIKLGKDRFSVYRIVTDTLSIDVTAAKGDNIETDLMNRDFTINAMACDLSTGKIIDRMGSVNDLRTHTVRMVSPAVFEDDPVRLIRAFRMAVTLNFKIEPVTYHTISRQSGAIGQMAAERIWSELRLIMACPRSWSTLVGMAETNVLFSIIPEITALQTCGQNRHHGTDVFTHTLRAYQALENLLNHPDQAFTQPAVGFFHKMGIEMQILIKLAVLLHDIGKPASRSQDDHGNVHFYGHAGKSASLSRTICKRLRMSNHHQSWVEHIVRYHQRPLSLYLAQKKQVSRPKTVGRFFRQCGPLTPFILLHAVADNLGKEAPNGHLNTDLIAFLKELLATYYRKRLNEDRTPLINGHDIMDRFKLAPSPWIGKILKHIEELQIAGSLTNRDQAMAWVSDYLTHNKE
ncbi:MAG: HD domain-containing protein [Desulfobacteraceae bacterium]|jgi:tRNA nucleotidyltransferase/poly(A) polymerase